MKTRLVRIGNSRGIRLPKPLIEQAGLGENLELWVTDGSIILSRSKRPRQGWAEAAAELAERADDGLLDAPASTLFDEEEWNW